MDSTGAAAAGFQPTQWSLVIAARSDPAARERALAKLCQLYWPPIYAFLRRRQFASADAEDLTQSFFAHILGSGFLERPDPAQGKFRSFLLSALKRFLSQTRTHDQAQKRGAGQTLVDLSAGTAEIELALTDADQLDPSEAFERSWAITLLAGSLRRLETEQIAAGRGEVFTILQPFLHHPPAPGDFEAAAVTLQTSRATVAVWLHRLNQRLAEIVKLEVAATLENPADADSELRHLLQVLRR